MAFGISGFLLNQSGLNILSAPGAFGGTGTRKPFTQTEIAYICSLQRAIPAAPVDGFIGAMSDVVAQFLGRTPMMIEDALTDPLLCREINAALSPRKALALRKQVQIVYLNDRGYPLSLKNPTWNDCVEGNPTYREIQMNIERNDKTGRPFSCDHYAFKGGEGNDTWRHPDFSDLYIRVIPGVAGGAPEVLVPEGTITKRIPNFASAK